MDKFWKRATMVGVILTVVIWGTLVLESLMEPFLQECYQLGEGAYCADYVYTPFGKVVIAGAVMVPILTLGIFIIGKIKGMEAETERTETEVSS